MAYSYRPGFIATIAAATLARLSYAVVAVERLTETTSTFLAHTVEFITAIFTVDYRPSASDAIELNRLHRELRADTLALTPLGERFKAFIRRRSRHARAIGDGFLNGEAGWLPAH